MNPIPFKQHRTNLLSQVSHWLSNRFSSDKVSLSNHQPTSSSLPSHATQKAMSAVPHTAKPMLSPSIDTQQLDAAWSEVYTASLRMLEQAITCYKHSDHLAALQATHHTLQSYGSSLNLERILPKNAAKRQQFLSSLSSYAQLPADIKAMLSSCSHQLDILDSSRKHPSKIQLKTVQGPWKNPNIESIITMKAQTLTIENIKKEGLAARQTYGTPQDPQELAALQYIDEKVHMSDIVLFQSILGQFVLGCAGQTPKKLVFANVTNKKTREICQLSSLENTSRAAPLNAEDFVSQTPLGKLAQHLMPALGFDITPQSVSITRVEGDPQPSSIVIAPK